MVLRADPLLYSWPYSFFPRHCESSASSSHNFYYSYAWERRSRHCSHTGWKRLQYHRRHETRRRTESVSQLRKLQCGNRRYGEFPQYSDQWVSPLHVEHPGTGNGRECFQHLRHDSNHRFWERQSLSHESHRVFVWAECRCKRWWYGDFHHCGLYEACRWWAVQCQPKCNTHRHLNYCSSGCVRILRLESGSHHGPGQSAHGDRRSRHFTRGRQHHHSSRRYSGGRDANSTGSSVSTQ